MIKITFKLGGDVIEVVVDQNNIMFCDVSTNNITTLDGLKLSRAGVLKEHPDLESNPEWKKEAIKRLKQFIKELETEKAKSEYIIKELIKFGYEPLYLQRAGSRPQRIR
jgi:type III secretory pathway component EscU